MKMTRILVKTLCILCLAFGYVAESSGSARVVIEVPNLATELSTDWRPTAGDSLSFRVKVTKPPHYSGGRLIATLSDVTNYLGECGNRMSLYNDLELRQDLLHNSGWRVGTTNVSLSHPIGTNKTGSPQTEWISLRVDCADYAAYGKLTFSTGGSSVAEAFPIVIVIPRDANGNKIADCWKNDGTKNYVADWDEESGPAAPNTQRGDALTVLDEYRGLYINGSWTDTDPEAWDVFLRLESGLSSAGSLPGMSVWSVGLNEVDHDGGVVYDFLIGGGTRFGITGTVYVYAIRLKNNYIAFDRKDPDNKVWGEMGIGPPSSHTKGNIFIRRIMRGLGAGQTKSGMIASTVAHEIGHGVHLDHCPDHNGLNCYMWENSAAAQHVTQYHSHHLVDYDLKRPSYGPQAPATIPDGKKRTYDPQTGTWSLGSVSSNSALLTPSGGVYTATAGSSHTADLTLTAAPSYVFWYVQAPGGSSPGTLEYQDTSGSLTSQLSYTFPTGVSGDYVFSVSGTLASDGSAITASYTVTVSSGGTSIPAPPAPAPASVSLSPGDGSYTTAVGDTHTADLTLGAAPSYISWYIQDPWNTSPRLVSTDTSGSLTSQLSYSLANPGNYVISVSGTDAASGAAITASYTLYVCSPDSDAYGCE